ncbi:MAG: DUF2085 domain-containing protein [Anaerolineales bacterium]|nr:DUF2085 domain-containing protein [Anaerolineales bacterium]
MRSMVSEGASFKQRLTATAPNRTADAFSRRWFRWFIILTGLWVGLPWLAPVFMRLGWEGPADAIYFLYSFQCHQLPQRSFFLFGQSLTYSLEQIQVVWDASLDPIVLRQFVGNAETGFKVAWSDRMVSAYTSIPLAALFWWPLRRRLRSLPFWVFVLFALPMAIDGVSHFISDLAGIGQGFRFTNDWLASLTNYSLSPSFYVGDALGSFNSWMRLLTGALFGIGLVWFSFPYFHSLIEGTAREIKDRSVRAGVDL